MSSTTPTSDGRQWATQTRLTAGIYTSTLLIVGVAVWFVLPHGSEMMPPLWVPAAQLGAGLVIWLVIDLIGYRALPIPVGTTNAEAWALARQRFQNGFVLRFALAESVAILSIAAAFVLRHGGFYIYAFGALVSLLLLVVHVWPGRRPVTKVAEALERDGVSSGLREAFGIPGRSGGAIQEL